MTYDDLGLHRVLEPPGVLPQAAQVLDATSPPRPNEIVIDVQALNIDSASFHQIVGEAGEDERAVAEAIGSIVAARGKMQNPVTGSGGVLLGSVREIGPQWHGPDNIEVGTEVVTLVSLTLTPLKLDQIDRVFFAADQVLCKGTAILWPSSPLVAMPQDMPARLAMSVLDVCGAPAQAQRLSQGADSMLILGFGKSGMLCAAAAREARGKGLRIVAIDRDEANMAALKEAGLIDDYALGDAKDAPGVMRLAQSLAGPQGADLVMNTCNIPHTEMSAILAAAPRGKVYFFNMATDFGRAALGSEGVGRDVDLYIGNGYAQGHAELSLGVARRHEVVRRQIEALLS